MVAFYDVALQATRYFDVEKYSLKGSIFQALTFFSVAKFFQRRQFCFVTLFKVFIHFRVAGCFSQGWIISTSWTESKTKMNMLSIYTFTILLSQMFVLQQETFFSVNFSLLKKLPEKYT